MLTPRVAEYIFFFSLLVGVAFLVWKLLAPFIGALALSAVIVTICYPLYERVLRIIPGRNPSLASFISVLLVILIVVLPLVVLGSFILKEALSIYALFNTDTQFSLEQWLSDIERYIQAIIPGFNLEVASYVRQVAGFIAGHIGAIFAGTASTIFFFFIALIGSFYFFRDGREFSKYLVKISPLPDDQDEKILKRLAISVRSVAMGTVLVALIQGTITGVGLWLFGFERAVLWGSAAALGALIPGIGTSIVFLPAVIYLIVTSSYVGAGGLAG